MFEMENERKIEDVMNVCRLCLGTDSLMSIFDDRIQIPENMKDVIQITTGITISPSDNISQKLCYKCVIITVRMFKFRSSSIVNDLELKEKAATIKKTSELHKSVQALLREHPKIVLPSSITKTNISPRVTINANTVQEWIVMFKKKKKLERKLNKTLARQKLKDAKKELERGATKSVISEEHKNISNVVLPHVNALPPVLEPATGLHVHSSENLVQNCNSYPGKTKESDKLLKKHVNIQENMEPNRDLERDIMPYVIPNKDVLLGHKEKNSVVELKNVDTDEQPPLLETAANLHLNNSSNGNNAHNGIAKDLKKRKHEKIKQGGFTTQENEKPKKDIERDITLHVITNKEVLSGDHRHSSNVELSPIDINVLPPPLLEPSNLHKNDFNATVQSSLLKYRKKKTVKKTNEGITTEDNKEMRSDKTQPNKAVLSDKNSETELISTDLPPLLEPAFVDHKNECRNDLKNPINDIHRDQGASANQIVSLEENINKRKFSLSLNHSKTKRMKFTSKGHEIYDSNSLLDLKYVNESIFLCDICNGILYNVKDLKKHKNKHMRCSLCKKSFRSWKETREHSEKYCEIKHIMNNLPKIYLQRCDKNVEIRQKYASAFVGFHDKLKVSTIKTTSRIQPDITHHKETTVKAPLEELKSKLDPHSRAITHEIYISDTEDPSFVAKREPEPPIEEPIRNISMTSKATETLSESTSRSTTVTPNPETLNAPCFKPEVNITGENVLDMNLDDEEGSLLRNLFTRTSVNTKESNIQTNLPNNSDIITSLNKDKLFELRDLRGYLNFYKIPVNVSYASRYSAKYGNDSSLLSKIDNSWSVIKPRKSPTVATDNEKTKISLNNATTDDRSIAPQAASVPPLILITTQSNTNSTQAAHTDRLQNVHRTTTSSTESSNQITEATRHEINKSLHPHTSKFNIGEIMQNCSKVQNNTSPQNIGDILYTANIHKEANAQINTNVQTNVRNIPNIHGSSNIQNNIRNMAPNKKITKIKENNVSSNNAVCSESPVANKSKTQAQMQPKQFKKIPRKATSKIFERNIFDLNSKSTNITRKTGPFAISTAPSGRTNNIAYSIQNSNLFVGTVSTSTKAVPQVVSNDSLNTTIDLVSEKTTTPLAMQKFVVVNSRVRVQPPNCKNVQRNGSYGENATSNNSINAPEVTIPSSIANIFNASVASSHVTNRNYCLTNVSTPPNIGVQKKYKTNVETQHITQTSNYQETPQGVIVLDDSPNAYSQSQTLPVNSTPSTSSISLVNGFVDTSVSLPISDLMPPPTKIPRQSTKHNQGPEASKILNSEITNQSINNSACTPAASRWNGNSDFVPLIRVKSVAELR